MCLSYFSLRVSSAIRDGQPHAAHSAVVFCLLHQWRVNVIYSISLSFLMPNQLQKASKVSLFCFLMLQIKDYFPARDSQQTLKNCALLVLLRSESKGQFKAMLVTLFDLQGISQLLLLWLGLLNQIDFVLYIFVHIFLVLIFWL